MIRKAEERDLNRIMEIWLEGNLQAHPFVPSEYWVGSFAAVRGAISQAEVWVWEENGRPEGFAGVVGNYVAGLFVDRAQRGKGIGSQLLQRVTQTRDSLVLRVYTQNTDAVRFYQNQGFCVRSEQLDPDTNQQELEMVFPGLE